MGLNFVVSDKDTEKSKKWQEQHKKICNIDVGAIGGRFSWSFTQTGLGCITILKCACGKEFDLTEFENW